MAYFECDTVKNVKTTLPRTSAENNQVYRAKSSPLSILIEKIQEGYAFPLSPSWWAGKDFFSYV